MATVESLQIAPVKSLQPLDVPYIEIGSNGLIRNDRTYMIVEAGEHVNANYLRGQTVQPGQAITQREDRILARITQEVIDNGGVRLNFEGRDLYVERRLQAHEDLIPVTLWSWIGKAALVSDEADKWVTEAVGRPARLVTVSEEEPRYVKDDPSNGRVGFADAHPVTVASLEGFEAINAQLRRMGRPEISYDQFRSTVVMRGLRPVIGRDNPKAFPEDYATSYTYRDTDSGLVVVLNRYSVSARCPMPDTHPRTGEFDSKRSVTRALVKAGRHGYKVDNGVPRQDAEVLFSQNCTITLPTDMPNGTTIVIPRGAKLHVAYSDRTNWAPSAKSLAT